MNIHRNGIDVAIAVSTSIPPTPPQSCTQSISTDNCLPLVSKKSKKRVSQRVRDELRRFRRKLKAACTWNAPKRPRNTSRYLRRLRAELAATRKDIQRLADANANVQQELRAMKSQLDAIAAHSYASAKRFAVSCSEHEVLVRTSVGYVLCQSSDYAVLATLVEAGETELGTRLLIQRLLRPGDIFVDVGSHLGVHTLAAVQALQGKGKVFSFEPFEVSNQLQQKTIRLNGCQHLVEIRQAAVASEPGERKLFLGHISTHQSIHPLDAAQALDGQFVTVPVIRLDDVIKGEDTVRLIKIDAEGAEVEVLQGSRSLIQNNPDVALIVEFAPMHLSRTGIPFEEWMQPFSNLGLVYKSIDPTTGRLDEVSQDFLKQTETANLFFARPKSSAWATLEQGT